MAKILCTEHYDTNPSMEVYETEIGTIGFCFVCNARVKLDSKVGVTNAKKEVTDVKSMLEYIQGLPVSRIRGFQLPYDDRGYYLVWPDKSFYKRRNFQGKIRYSGPAGVKPTLMLFKGSVDRLVLIEGELNAMTINEYAKSTYTIASPGAASEFMRHIKQYKGYKKITLVMDHDPAGIAFGLQLKNKLLEQGRHVTLVTRTKDYNDVLTEHGSEAVKLEFEKDLK